MGNIMDYISWRGDLSFAQSPFNEVDNLILACFFVCESRRDSGSVRAKRDRTEKTGQRI